MTMLSARASYRRRLVLSTALVGAALLATEAAQAQTLPTGPSFPVVQTDPTISTAADTMTVALNQNRTIINWTSFNIGTTLSHTETVEFRNGATSPSAAVAVLNRDLSGSPSGIYGSLLSDPNIAVYLINENGILFGNGANVNVGSLVASTLDLANADFLDGASYNFAGSGTNGIVVDNGAAIATNGAPGDLVLLGAYFDIRAGSTLTASGDVAIAAASDLDISFGTGSPLSMTINQGTPVAGPFVVGGSVNGQNVYVALATRASVLNALLNVTGQVTATTALATDRGIVLAAGTSGSGVTVATGGGNDTSGPGAIQISGALNAQRAAPTAAANVEVRARGSITGSNTIDADGRIDVASTQSDVTLTAALTAGEGIGVNAQGNVDVRDATATTGDLTLSGGAVLMNASSLTAQNGNISVTGPTSLTGSSSVSAAAAGATVTFNGAVDGPGSLTATSGAGTTFNADVGAGSPLGTLTVHGPTILNAGAVMANAGISLDRVTIGASAPGSVTIDAGGGALTVNGDILAATADANALTLGGSTVNVGNVGVGGRLASVTFQDPTLLSGNVDVANAATFQGSLGLAGPGNRRITAGTASFQTVDSTVAGSTGLVVNTGGAAVFNGALGGGGALAALDVTAGPIVTHNVNVDGDVTLRAGTSTIDVQGNLVVGGNYTVTAADFLGSALAPSLGGAGSDFTITDTAGGLVLGAITAPGTLSVTVQNGGALTVNGALASTNENILLATQGGGGIMLNAGLSVGLVGGLVDLNSSAGISQTAGGIAAAQLAIRAAGNVD
ncbi:MAG: filamentous hemagglutinin N-terminal domain-containing protein, partial [Frankiaceae bacterium]|nr:filamentous hemagglutinin N-terminal domain-containing protein [Frankiaceae bacterium]